MLNKTKKEEPKVSMIITYYNLADYIDESIKSALNQTYKNLEIILVNDGSNEEKSINKLEEIKIKYKNKIKFIDQKNSGVSSARNNGIKKSRGEFICCLDGDDILEPEYIKKTTNLIIENKKYKVVTTQLKFFGEYEGIWNPSNKIVDLLIENCIHVSSLFSKKVWEEVGGYSISDGFYYEDWEFWIKIAGKGYKWGIINEPLFNYRVRKVSRVSESNKNRIKLIQENVIKNQNIYNKYYKEVICSLFEKNEQIANKRINDIEFEKKRLTKIYKNKEKKLKAEIKNLLKKKHLINS